MKNEGHARLRVFVLFCATVISAAGLAGKAEAACIGRNVTVSPMPFRPGDHIKIKAECNCVFNNVTMLVSVTAGTDSFPPITTPNLGPVSNGQIKSFEIDWQVPSDLLADHLAVWVVFLEGDEKWIGEPGVQPSLKLVARCTKPPGGIGRAQCKYATAKYWITTTKQN
jgi:hypothetical protein